MSSLSGSGQGRFYIIGNCISYYIKKASGRMRTRANKNYVVSVSVFTSVVARRASLALSNALGARMCQGTFFVL